MCQRIFEACLLMERRPEIAFRDGLFHVTEYCGDTITLRRCYMPNLFLNTIVGALDAVEAYRATQPAEAVVLPFPLKIAN